MPTYTQTNYKDQLADTIALSNIANEVNIQNIMNRAARMVNSEIDLRSAKRRSALTPKLFDDIYDYTCPTDLKDEAIIDLIPQTQRSLNSRLSLVPNEYFDRKKTILKNMVTVTDDDFTRKVRADLDVNDTSLVLSSLDSLTAGGGTWSVFGNSENLAADEDNFVEGSGSVFFDLATGTTAGITNSDVDEFNITDYRDNGSAFVWAYVNLTTNLTNFILRVGNDSSNYDSMTVTTQNDGTAFTAGWNLLRFDFSGKTTTGTVTETTCDYVALYMTKASGKVDDGYRFDHLTLHTGQYYDIAYYSKYPWQTSAGVYIENSTAATDKLNCDTDELDLFVFKGKAELYSELEDFNQADRAEAKYQAAKTAYQSRNPSQRLKRTISYY